MNFRLLFIAMPLLASVGCMTRGFNSDVSARSQESGWRHVEPLRSPEGLVLQIDFKAFKERVDNCFSCNDEYKAGPLWFNVTGPMVKPESKVQVVFVSFRTAPQGVNLPVEQKSVQVVDMSYYKDRQAFSGAVAPVIVHESGTGGTWNYHQEAAVVVDGKWYKQNESNNFHFDIFNSHKEY